MSRFKWYRKWKGGVWFHNRYRFDMVLIFCWERTPASNSMWVLPQRIMEVEVY